MRDSLSGINSLDIGNNQISEDSTDADKNKRWCKLPLPEGQRYKECSLKISCSQCLQEYMDAFRDNLKDFR